MAATDTNDNIINYAGDFRIKVCRIISYRKAEGTELAFRVSILPQTLTISLVEDITSPTMSGHIDVADAQDIRTLLPLTGMERLELHLFTPGQPEIKFLESETDTFNIYKIDKIRNSGGTARQQIYRIHFTSREVYRNATTRVSRAYAGPVENAVYDILHNKLDTRKPIFLEPTSTNAKFVIPNIKPFNAIKFFQSQAISNKYKNAGYLFYETTQGFNFRSIESLMALSGTVAKPPIELYSMQPANKRDDKQDKDIIKDLKSPMNYSFEKVVNTLEELNQGLYANRLIVNDIYNKKIETFDYNYHEAFGEHFHTEHFDGDKTETKYIKPTAFYEDTGKFLSDFPMAKLMSVVDTQKLHNDYDPPKPEDILPNSISQRTQMANFHLLMSVPGQTRINAGEMIIFALPSQRPVPHDKAQEHNPHYSGRYLILSLKHKFDVIEQKHSMNIRAVKDAVRTELPVGLDEVVPLPEKKEAISVYDEDELEINRG